MERLTEFCTFSRSVKDIWMVCGAILCALPGIFYLWAAFYTDGGAKIFEWCLFLTMVYFIACLSILGYVVMRTCIERISVKVSFFVSTLIRIFLKDMRADGTRRDMDVEAQLQAVEMEH
jgi:hypothetical protein